jgi:hypothetical protein
MNRFLKKKLTYNGLGKLSSELEKISPEDSAKVALGIQMVFENFDCEPNGGIIFDIIDYLNYKSIKTEKKIHNKSYNEKNK